MSEGKDATPLPLYLSVALLAAVVGFALIGLVRPETTRLLVIVQAVGGMLLGTAHWLGAHLWRRIGAELVA